MHWFLTVGWIIIIRFVIFIFIIVILCPIVKLCGLFIASDDMMSTPLVLLGANNKLWPGRRL